MTPLSHKKAVNYAKVAVLVFHFDASLSIILVYNQ